MAKIDLKNCTIKIADGGSGTNRKTLDVKIGDGTITWSEKRNMEYQKDRGVLDTVREGDEEPVDVRLDFMYEFLATSGAGTVPTVEEALKKRGPASTWVSSSADPCEPYAVDIEIIHTPPCGGATTETVLIQDYRYETLDHDPKAGTVSSSGKANITEPTITRGT
jgi:hypothetical protein